MTAISYWLLAVGKAERMGTEVLGQKANSQQPTAPVKPAPPTPRRTNWISQ